MSGRRGARRSNYRAAVERLEELDGTEHPDEEFVRRIGAVLDELPKLSSRRWELVLAMESALSAEHVVSAMAGGPVDVISDISRENAIRAGARRRVLDEPLLEAESIARALGSRSVNVSQYASLKRRRGELLGLPVANRYLFPAFQLDVSRQRVIPVVASVNRLIGADEDAWGTASWWFSPNDRLGGERPADLASDESRAADIEAAARWLLAPIG